MKILLLFLFTTFYSTAQNIDFEKVGVKPAKFDVFWGNDISDNNYFSTGNNLYKINEKDTLNYTNNKFGKITSLGKVKPFEKVIFFDKSDLLYLFEDKLVYYSIDNQLEMNISIDEKLIKNFFYKDGILSIFTDYQISTYQIKK